MNNEVGTVISSLIESGEKKALIGGILADSLSICSTDPNDPEIVLNSTETIPI